MRGPSGRALRLRAPGQRARIAVSAATTSTDALLRGELVFALKPLGFHDDDREHPLVSLGAWEEPGSLHLVKAGKADGNRLLVTFFDANGVSHRSAVPASAYTWRPGRWLELSLAWDFAARPHEPNLWLRIDGRERPLLPSSKGSPAMPSDAALVSARSLHLGGSPGVASAEATTDAVFDRLRLYPTRRDPALDEEAPTARLSRNGSGGTAAGLELFEVRARDAGGIERVELEIDGLRVGASSDTAPFVLAWDTRRASNGEHSVRALATDRAGNVGASDPLALRVANGSGDRGFFDHFADADLREVWRSDLQGAGSLALSDSAVHCRSPKPGDRCVLIAREPLAPERSQLWLAAISSGAARGSRTWLRVLEGERVPHGAAAAETIERIGVRYVPDAFPDLADAAHAQAGERLGSLRLTGVRGDEVAIEWDASRELWSGSEAAPLRAVAEGDTLLVGLELDGVRGAWRLLVWGRRGEGAEAGVAFDPEQGLRLVVLTPWVEWAPRVARAPLWLVLGGDEAGALRVEWVRRDAGPRRHAYLGALGALGAPGARAGRHAIAHGWGYEGAGGSVELIVPAGRQPLVTEAEPGAWDGLGPGNAFVLYDPALGEYYMTYSARRDRGHFEAGLMTASAPEGPFERGVARPLLAARPGTHEEQVLQAISLKDLGEPDPARRYKLLYTVRSALDSGQRLALATAASMLGPWQREGVVLERGEPGSDSEGGVGRALAVWIDDAWSVLFSARTPVERGGSQRVGHARGPRLDALEPGARVADNHVGPSLVLAGGFDGRRIEVPSSAGLVEDAYVELGQPGAPVGDAPHAASRIRRVLSPSAIELYHGVGPFAAEPAAMLVPASGAKRVGFADLRRARDRWDLYVTFSGGFGRWHAFDGDTANTGLLAMRRPGAPAVWNELATPVATRGRFPDGLVFEGLSFVHWPVQRAGGVRDQEPPRVRVVSPRHGESLAGWVRLSARASDDVGVESVRFEIDGRPLGRPAGLSPFEAGWDARKASPGEHRIEAIATDLSGRETRSEPVRARVVAAP